MQVCVENMCLTVCVISLSEAKSHIIVSDTKKEHIAEIRRRVTAVMTFDLNLKNWIQLEKEEATLPGSYVTSAAAIMHQLIIII